jgi:hypothetical protein
MILRTGVAHPIVALAWRFAIAIAAGYALLVALTFSPTRSARMDASARTAESPSADDNAADAAAGDPASFAEITERPLFYPSRKPWTPPPPPPPPPAPTPVAKAPSPLTNYALVGVIVSGDQRSALIRPPGNKKAITITEGQDLAGWKLQEITSVSLRFGAGDASYEMKFRKPSESPR